MKKLKDKSVEQILNSYDFPHRFLVYYASQVAKVSVKDHIKDPDERIVKALDISERFGNGEDFDKETLTKAIDAAYAANAYSANASASYAAYSANAYSASYAANASADIYANAANASASYAANADYAAYAANAAYYNSQKKSKDFLLDMIEKRLTKIEILILGFENIKC